MSRTHTQNINTKVTHQVNTESEHENDAGSMTLHHLDNTPSITSHSLSIHNVSSTSPLHWQSNVGLLPHDEQTLRLLLRQITDKQTEVRQAIRTLDEKHIAYKDGEYANRVAVYETEIEQQKIQIDTLHEKLTTATQQYEQAQQQLNDVQRQLHDTQQQVLINKQLVLQYENDQQQAQQQLDQMKLSNTDCMLHEAELNKQIQLKQAQITLLDQQMETVQNAYNVLQQQVLHIVCRQCSLSFKIHRLINF